VFMQKLIGDALSEDTRRRDPWLHAVMMTLKRIAWESPKSLSCSEPEFREIVRTVSREFEGNEATLLRTAQMGNFLRLSEGRVFPAIPLLGRLAIGTSPLSW